MRDVKRDNGMTKSDNPKVLEYQAEKSKVKILAKF